MKNILLKLYFGIIILAMLIYNSVCGLIEGVITFITFYPFNGETVLSAIPTISQILLSCIICNFYGVITLNFVYDLIKEQKINIIKVIAIFMYFPFVTLVFLGLVMIFFSDFPQLVY